MYRIKYWLQETVESGRWCLTGTMSRGIAEKIVESNVYERAECFPDEEYKTCRNCADRIGEECEKHGGREIYLEDSCNGWSDHA